MMLPDKKQLKVIFVVFFLTVVLSHLAFAQLYPGWKMRDGAENEAANAKSISDALQAGTLDKPKFDAYFNNYYFHRWTLPGHFDNLNLYVRQNLLGNDLEKATGQAREYLLGRTLAAMGKMRGDPAVHPAVRYNAVLVLGLLYDDVAKTKLHAKALPVLIDEYLKPEAPDVNRLGALIGISRFAQLGIEDQQLRNEIVPQLLLELVKQKKTPTGRTPDVHNYFFRVRAIEGLSGLLRSVGPKPEYVEPLLDLIQDSTELDQLRYLAAKALAEINYSQAVAGGITVDVNRIAVALSDLARYACDEEKRYIERLEKGTGRSSSSPSGPPSSGRSGGGNRFGTSSEDSSSSMSSAPATSLAPSSGANAKEVDDNRIEHCIVRNKFAFGAVQEAIRGYSGPDAGLLNALQTVNTPESLANQKILGQIDRIIKDEYIKFLNTGPEQARSSQSRTAAKGTKVTLKNITDELEKLSEKIEDIIKKGPANLPTSITDDDDEPTEPGPVIEGREVNF